MNSLLNLEIIEEKANQMTTPPPRISKKIAMATKIIVIIYPLADWLTGKSYQLCLKMSKDVNCWYQVWCKPHICIICTHNITCDSIRIESACIVGLTGLIPYMLV